MSFNEYALFCQFLQEQFQKDDHFLDHPCILTINFNSVLGTCGLNNTHIRNTWAFVKNTLPLPHLSFNKPDPPGVRDRTALLGNYAT